MRPIHSCTVTGKGMTLEDLQKKFETQAAVAELLKMLRPNMVGGSGSGADQQQAMGSLSGASAAAAAALLRGHGLPPQLHQQLLLRQEQAHQLRGHVLPPQLQLQQLVVDRQIEHLKYHATAAVAAAASSSLAMPATTSTPAIPAAVSQPLPDSRNAANRSAVKDAGGPPTHIEPAQSWSIEREWDWEKV